MLTQWQRTDAIIRFNFDRLDQNGRWVADLTPYVSRQSPPIIRHDSTAGVKRTLSMTLLGAPTLNPLQDLIRPHCQMRMPDGGFIDLALGIFTLMLPGKTITPGPTIRQIDGADLGQLLLDGAFTTSYGVPAGTNYLAAIRSVITSANLPTNFLAAPFGMLIPDVGKVLPATLGWVEGDTRIKAINDLLVAINYYPSWWDETGQLRSSPIPDYNTVTPAFTFDATKGKVQIVTPIREAPDPGKAFNIFPVIVEDPRRGAFAAPYTNSNPLSPISTVNWHPKTAPPIRDSSIVDYITAGQRGRSEAQASARNYDIWVVSTQCWPFSQDQDIYGLTFKSTDEGLVSFLAVESFWELTCAVSAPTVHHLARISPA